MTKADRQAQLVEICNVLYNLMYFRAKGEMIKRHVLEHSKCTDPWGLEDNDQG